MANIGVESIAMDKTGIWTHVYLYIMYVMQFMQPFNVVYTYKMPLFADDYLRYHTITSAHGYMPIQDDLNALTAWAGLSSFITSLKCLPL